MFAEISYRRFLSSQNTAKKRVGSLADQVMAV